MAQAEACAIRFKNPKKIENLVVERDQNLPNIFLKKITQK
jgi:hypothetical protein